MRIDCRRQRRGAQAFVGSLFLLAATAVLLSACQQPSAPSTQSSTYQQKQSGTGEAGRHCCRHAGKNNSK